MAIFSKADFGLPALTQVFQVDATNIEEVIHLIAVLRWQDAEEKDSVDPVPWATRVENVSLKLSLEKADQNAKDICHFTQGLVKNLVEHKALTMGQLRQMVKYDSIAAEVFTDLYPERSDDEWISSENEFFTNGLSSTTSFYLWRRISEELKTFLSSLSGHFRPCAECSNPFPVFDYESTRIYCSRRCINRAGERRRYNERKENVESKIP